LPDGKFCTCEECARSKYGPIGNEERLGRVGINPRHVKNGVLKPGIFPPTHLERKGLSVTRVDVIDLDELTKQAQKQVINEGEMVEGVVLLETAVIRAEIDEHGNRCLCAFDDPVDGNEAHACILRSANQDETEIRRLRGRLLELYPKTTPLSEVYPAGDGES